MVFSSNFGYDGHAVETDDETVVHVSSAFSRVSLTISGRVSDIYAMPLFICSFMLSEIPLRKDNHDKRLWERAPFHLFSLYSSIVFLSGLRGNAEQRFLRKFHSVTTMGDEDRIRSQDKSRAVSVPLSSYMSMTRDRTAP